MLSTTDQLLEGEDAHEAHPAEPSAPIRRLRRITLTASIEALVTDAEFGTLKDQMQERAIDLTESIQSEGMEIRATSVHEDR